MMLIIICLYRGFVTKSELNFQYLGPLGLHWVAILSELVLWSLLMAGRISQLTVKGAVVFVIS